MADIKKELERLKSSKEFESYKKDNPECYLASAFIITQPKKIDEAELEIDFYSPKSNKMEGFLMKNDIVKKPEDKVFQKKKEAVKELDIDKVKTDLDKAVETAEALRADKHPGDLPSKYIIVLQNIDGKEVWNITMLSDTLKLINIRLSAENLELISEKMENLLNFRVSK